ncbi:hypothetical protein FXV77_06290 [Sphingobacterium phlebotomi]|uniref:TonB C-terminal domain-containing protein n=1 Tax=Sphingobacterium phlebotomi TaxID=2605433 RepID=A0A5D4HBN4_9SPHI|nr:hypothetical protein [Sphingobacterium phlebotomi]TYR37603.1 hypothetical protein FXV77_06290 [Sphingobacterium phlebotomi]
MPIVEETYIVTNRLKLKGTYKSKSSKRFIGKKYEFFENGSLKSEENYADNSELIDSAFYFHENGRIKTAFFYSSSIDKKESLKIEKPLILIYQDSSGVTHLENGDGFAVLDYRNDNVEKGYYKSHRKVGEWTGTFMHDKYTFTEVYEDGELLSCVAKDSLGVETPYDSSRFMVTPEYPGGFGRLRMFVARNYQFPKEAIAKRVSGVVQVEFVVERDGKMSNPITLNL